MFPLLNKCSYVSCVEERKTISPVVHQLDQFLF